MEPQPSTLQQRHANQSGSPTGTQHIELTQLHTSTIEHGTRRIGSRIPDPSDYDRAIHPTLDRWDVAALIINKMVGTGIFTGPPQVLLYTQNKAMAMTFWVLGLIYTYLW